MNKVIIVEDDRIIRRSLCSVPWKEHGFILAGEATNGENAIELIEKEQPQVVISDITMPFMNGLEMAKLIRETSPHTKVIFLTGYEDFKYAQEAVKLKAFDYLLKPVKMAELIEKVKKAGAESNREVDKEKRFVDSLPLLEQRLLRKMMSTQNEESIIDIEKELVELGMKLEGPYFAAMLIHLNSSDEEEEVENKKKLTEILFELQPENKDSYLVNGEINEMALLLCLENDCEKSKKELALEILEQINKQVAKIATITIGRTYDNQFEIGTSFVESRLAMDMKHIMGTSRVYSIEDTIPSTLQNMNYLKELDETFKNYIKLGLPHKARETLDQLSTAITESKSIPLSETKLLALKYSTLVFYQIKRWKEGDIEGFNELEFYNLILQLESLQEMTSILGGLIEEWTNSMSKANDPNRNTLVDKAMEYMKKNYHDEALTQRKVANEIFVSAPYLSNLFKIEKGLNFGDYLLNLRMNKAMDLLQSHNAKIYKVAGNVGYSNPQYFSVCFKKYTGYTPGEYRKSVDSITYYPKKDIF